MQLFGRAQCLPFASSQETTEVLGLPMEALIARQRLKAEEEEEEGGRRGEGPERPMELKADEEENNRKRPAEGAPPISGQAGNPGEGLLQCDPLTPPVVLRGENGGEPPVKNGPEKEKDPWVRIKPPRELFLPLKEHYPISPYQMWWATQFDYWVTKARMDPFSVVFDEGVILVWWAFYYDLGREDPNSWMWAYPRGEERWIGGYVNPRGIFIGSDGRVKGCETPDVFYPEEWYPHSDESTEISQGWEGCDQFSSPFQGMKFCSKGKYALHPDPTGVLEAISSRNGKWVVWSALDLVDEMPPVEFPVEDEKPYVKVERWLLSDGCVWHQMGDGCWWFSYPERGFAPGNFRGTPLRNWATSGAPPMVRVYRGSLLFWYFSDPHRGFLERNLPLEFFLQL